MPETTRYLSSHVIQELAREIDENQGRELFAVLTREDEESVYTAVKVICRGTHSEVPALISRVKPGEMTLHNHPSGVLQPSQQDMHMATLFGEEGVGSMIVNNEVSHCIVVAEPSSEPKPVNVEATEVAAIFATNGPLSSQLENYEPRESQVQMAHAVTEAINKEKILAVEAGTGTGKSLAYMIPALLWTKHNKGRVVVATKTIALQEQLVFKDIPLARKVVPNAPQASLVKGRGNYVCLRKLGDLQTNQMELFTEEESSLKKEIRDLQGWVEETGSGDRADLPFVPSRDAWEMVRSDADMCLGAKCRFFQKAPFYESRRRAAQAKVLVLNQALLFADLALRSASGNYTASAVIPPYEHIILDEAHSIEDIATDHFGQKIASFGLRITLGKFLSRSRGNKGLLSRLFQAGVEHGALDLVKKLEETLIPEFRQSQDALLEQLYSMSRALHDALNPDQKRQQVVWLKETLLESGKLDEAKMEAKALLAMLHELALTTRKIRREAKSQTDRFLEKTSGLVIELDARLSRLEGTMGALKNFAIRSDGNQVPWLELKKGRQFDEFEYKVSPLNVAPMLREALFKPFRSIIMTSATLDLKDDFKFLSDRNGLRGWEEKEWAFRTYASPFDYSAQTCLYLTHLPSNPNQGSFTTDLAEVILRTVFSGYPGGTLVLFTSYNLLNNMARQIEGPLAKAGIDLLVQGRAARSHLIERMKQTQGVLLGTDSFWEGIDLPGAALTKVIITKLPFRQVGDPIFEARCAAMEAEGRSSFKDYSLPLALLKFKQGAGRLIRSKKDRGVLIVADNRIHNKGYGKQFLSLVDTYPLWQITPKELSLYLGGGE